MLVTFVTSGWNSYMRGDVASFDEEKAQQLIKAKIARKATDRETVEGRPMNDWPTGGDAPPRPPKGEREFVRFDKGYAPYNRGEVAAFPEELADQLVDAEIAHRPTKDELASLQQKVIERNTPATRVLVRLLKAVPPCNVGETVSYDREFATMLIEKQIAERVEPLAPAPAPAAATDDEPPPPTRGGRRGLDRAVKRAPVEK